MTNEDPSSREMRRYRRIPEKVAIAVSEITYPLPEGGGQSAVARNIGEDGICFAIDRGFAPGTVLGLKIRLTGWQRHKRSYAVLIDDAQATAPLTAVAEVVWCRRTDAEGGSHEVGVKFIDIYEDDYRALRAHLKEIV